MRPARFVMLVALPLLALQAGAGAFEWEAASPETLGLDPAKLAALRVDLAGRDTKAILVARRDRIALEWYAPGHAAGKRHYTASLAKALVGGLSLALAFEDGCLALDDPASRHIPAWRDDAKKSRITIRQLATHSSGVEDAADPGSGKSHDELPGWKGRFWQGRSSRLDGESTGVRIDPFSIAVHEAPVVFAPGEGFAYSNPGMAALSYAVTASLREGPRKDIRRLLSERVFEPLGLSGSDWEIGYGRTYVVDGLPLVANWGGGGFTARAVAKIGRLVLERGAWDGKEVLRPVLEPGRRLARSAPRRRGRGRGGPPGAPRRAEPRARRRPKRRRHGAGRRLLGCARAPPLRARRRRGGGSSARRGRGALPAEPGAPPDRLGAEGIDHPPRARERQLAPRLGGGRLPLHGLRRRPGLRAVRASQAERRPGEGDRLPGGGRRPS